MSNQRDKAEPQTASDPLRPTLQYMAEQSGMSVTTISRVLSGQGERYRISKQTETMVHELARKFNFVPDRPARELRLKKTLTIGLVVPDLSNPFFAAIAREVTFGSRKQGYSLYLCVSQDTTELEVQQLAVLKSRSVAGVVLCPVGQSSRHLEEFVQARYPIVLVDRFFPDLPLPYVSSDNVSAARRATELLIAHGHSRVACLQGVRGTSTNEFRICGYKEALAAHQLPIEEDLIVGDSFSVQSGYIGTQLLLTREPGVKAILALSNLNALGAIRALAEERLKIPEDISLVSFDDTPFCAYLRPPLTTVVQQSSSMGEVAVKLLFHQIHSPGCQAKGGVLLPATLVIRQSVGRVIPPRSTSHGQDHKVDLPRMPSSAL